MLSTALNISTKLLWKQPAFFSSLTAEIVAQIINCLTV